ncbi:hypothetical protein ACHAXS_005493 [Conticribra weissflogii]
MSLATSTGGGAGLSAGGAGLSVAAMAHDAGANAALSHTHHAHAHHHGSIPGGTSSSAAPPVSHAALGADLLDRTQSFLSGKGVRNAAKLPIAAVDLYGDKCHAAYFPPVAAAGEEENGQTTMTTTGVLVRTIGGLWANRDDHSADGSRAGGHVVLKREDDASYKAVKKYLSTGSGKGAVLRRSLLEDARDLRSTNAAIVLPRPHLLLGARSEDDLSSAARAALGPLLASRQTSASASCAIERDPDACLSVVTIALDGGAAPKGDDFDRVAFRMKLSSKKKAATILPEEAVGISIALARKRVEKAYVADVPDSDLARDDPDGDDDDDEERYGDFPTAFAIPGWAATDPALEALTDAAGGSSSPCGPSLHQRSVAACVGALLPVVGNAGPSRPTPSKLTKLLSDAIRAKAAEAAREAARVAARTRTDPVDPEPHVPLVVLVGATDDGVEVTAVQLSEPQGSEEEVHCPFGDVSVVSSVCGCRGDGMKGGGGGGGRLDVDVVEEKLEWAMDRLRRQVGFLAPESEEPAAIVTYGTIATQLRVATRLKAILAGYGKEARDDAKRRSQDDDKHEDKADDDDWDGWDQDIPLLSTHESCTSAGLAVLAASAHSRVKLVVSVKGSDGKHRPKPKPALRIKDVATCAVAVSFNYFGGESSKWTDPKVLFDFDRRVPAGPYRLDFSAAECAAHVRYATSGAAKNRREIPDENVLMTMAKSLEGTRAIPEREDAAMNLRFRVLQTTTREEEEEGKGRKWIRVGDDMSPLTMEHSQRDEGESGRDHLVACESAVLEISLNPVGLITTGLTTNGETIVQATKSARNSKLLKWTGIIGALAFVGGFLVKSFVEERVFERDTQRVLAYYKHAAPNSFHDGDERHARYMVWKYKGKKDALWRRLEAKYGVPVKHAWEWQEEDGMEGDKRETKEAEEEDAEDLDGSEGSEEL